MTPGGRVVPALDALSSTDRGFVTWVAGMLREPIDQVWATLCAGATRVDGKRITALDLSPIGRGLRERLGPRPLQLPLAGLVATELDLSGLDLDALDLRLLPQVEVLRAADNRLSAIDLSENRALRTLDLTGNRLMTLELGAHARLEDLRCAGNGLAVLVVPPSIRTLDASRNQLMVLELPALPHATGLNLYRNALARFVLTEAPALERLDLGRNELDAVSLPRLPSLRWLSVARNRLDFLDLAPVPHLAALRCHGNYLEALDLRPCAALVTLEARGNQIRTLLLPPTPALEEIDLSDNRLEAFDAACPRLEVLRLGGNELGALSCAGLPRLVALDVRENALATLDVRGAPQLVELRCGNNRLAHLDVRGNPHLCRLQTRDATGGGPAVEADDRQLDRIPELRALTRRGTGAADPAAMDPYELHELAASLGGRDAEARLRAIVDAPRVDLGTLLMTYWTGSPHYYLKYADASEVPDFERPGFELLAAIEERVGRGAWRTAVIEFDPRRDRHTRSPRGVDWTVDDRVVKGEVRRVIPGFMLRTSGGA